MGNRAIITLQDQHDRTHPVAIYVHWNGGLESVLAFIKYTYETFERGQDDLFTFHARLVRSSATSSPRGFPSTGFQPRTSGDWKTLATMAGFTSILHLKAMNS